MIQAIDSTQKSRLNVLHGFSTNLDVNEAVRELAAQIWQPQNAIYLVFFTDEYDWQQLGRALQENLPAPVIGCTSAGQLSPVGFQRGGLSGASLASDELIAIPYCIHPLSSLVEQVGNMAVDIQDRLIRSKMQAFGLLLVDGLSPHQELLTASLYKMLGDVPLIGGSAGDMLKFQKTAVYYEGKLFSDAAVFVLFLTTLPFYAFKHHHFRPTTTRLVITEAEPEQRIVREINGEPAVESYARLIGVPVDQLDRAVFSCHPLLLRLGSEYFVRSIASIEPNGCLRFFCALETGLVLTIGEGHPGIESLARCLSRVKDHIGDPEVIIGCDCILRRIEMENRSLDGPVGQLLAENKVVGFSTYGEQFNSIHINQTFTGIALAG